MLTRESRDADAYWILLVRTNYAQMKMPVRSQQLQLDMPFGRQGITSVTFSSAMQTRMKTVVICSFFMHVVNWRSISN